MRKSLCVKTTNLYQPRDLRTIKHFGCLEITNYSLKCCKRNLSINKSRFHYGWNLPGLVLGSRKRLDSKRPRFTSLDLFSRLLEAIRITQIKADTSAPMIKYTVIKIPIILCALLFVFAVRCMNKGKPGKKTFSNQCQYHTCCNEK